MTLQDLEDSIDLTPIPGVTCRGVGDRRHLTIGPIKVRVAVRDDLEPDGDLVMAVYDGERCRGGDAYFSSANGARAALRAICADYLLRSPRNPFAVSAHKVALLDGGLYADVLREHLTMARDNLNAILSVKP
jgi:hypothetical protein